MTDEPILEFDGEYRWLSNFYDYIVDLGGRMFASGEHAFQATKTFDPKEQREIQLARSPGQAKRVGQEVTLRPGWDDGLSIEMMRLVVAAKFTGDNALTPKLLATGDALLVEGNNWRDNFWGACWEPLWATERDDPRPSWARRENATGGADFLVGENHLGLLLMERRGELGGQA